MTNYPVLSLLSHEKIGPSMLAALSPKMSDQPSVKIVTHTNGGITFAQVKERGVEVKGVTFHRFEEEV